MSDKSPEMENFLNGLAKDFFGCDRAEAMKSAKCVMCGGPAVEFRDELSRKEFGISGACQKCQDSVFGE
jgi:hypothetical protein